MKIQFISTSLYYVSFHRYADSYFYPQGNRFDTHKLSRTLNFWNSLNFVQLNESKTVIVLFRHPSGWLCWHKTVARCLGRLFRQWPELGGSASFNSCVNVDHVCAYAVKLFQVWLLLIFLTIMCCKSNVCTGCLISFFSFPCLTAVTAVWDCLCEITGHFITDVHCLWRKSRF